MRKCETIYHKFKQSKVNRDYKDVVTLFEGYDFVVDKSKGKGGHAGVYHPLYEDIPIWTLSHDRPVGVYHVKKALEMVEEVMERE